MAVVVAVVPRPHSHRSYRTSPVHSSTCTAMPKWMRSYRYRPPPAVRAVVLVLVAVVPVVVVVATVEMPPPPHIPNRCLSR